MSTQPQPVPTSAGAGEVSAIANMLAIPASQVLAFNTAYAANPPEPVQLLLSTPVSERGPMIAALLAQKVPLDLEIMILGSDPFLTMWTRVQDGYADAKTGRGWYPAAEAPPLSVAPGIVLPGLPVYDPNTPIAPYVVVSINPADFPPFLPVAPVAPPAPQNVVGAAYPGSSLFMTGPGFEAWLGQSIPVNGQYPPVQQNGQTFQLVQYQTLPGFLGAYFKLVS